MHLSALKRRCAQPTKNRASVALLVPASVQQQNHVDEALNRLRAPGHQIDVRIGMGPIERRIPLRVIAAVSLFAEAVRHQFLDHFPEARISWTLFSSTAKQVTAGNAGLGVEDPAFLSLPFLKFAEASLRQFVDKSDAIRLVVASQAQEIPSDVALSAYERLSAEDKRWFDSRSARWGGNGLFYGAEHAAPTMFGDVLGMEEVAPDIRIFVGPRPEERFWRLRRLVAEEMAGQGRETVPSLGFIVTGCRIPSYHPTVTDPYLDEVSNISLDALTKKVGFMTNPLYGGNYGLKTEKRRLLSLLPEHFELLKMLSKQLEVDGEAPSPLDEFEVVLNSPVGAEVAS